MTTAVDRYWTGHTVRAARFTSAARVERYLEWRFDQYPLFREFSGLWGDHDGEIVLDYGCGPGNDLIGFTIHTGARRLIGLDVSPTALELARERLALHGVIRPRRAAPGPMTTRRSRSRTPASTTSTARACCTTPADPEAILAELAACSGPAARDDHGLQPRQRLAAPLHRVRAMIVEGAFARTRCRGGVRAQHRRPGLPDRALLRRRRLPRLCRGAGLRRRRHWRLPVRARAPGAGASSPRALADGRLAAEHRGFLRELDVRLRRVPMYAAGTLASAARSGCTVHDEHGQDGRRRRARRLPPPAAPLDQGRLDGARAPALVLAAQPPPRLGGERRHRFPRGLARSRVPRDPPALLSCSGWRSTTSTTRLQYLDGSDAYKVAFLQDECTRCRRRLGFLNDDHIDCVYTCPEPSEFDKVYRHYTGVPELVSNIPGYVSAQRRLRPGASPSRASAHRRRRVPRTAAPALSRGRRDGEARDRPCDSASWPPVPACASTSPPARRTGCTAMTGTASWPTAAPCWASSRASLFDLEDEVTTSTAAAERDGLPVGVEDLRRCRVGRTSSIYRTISPRHFEAAALASARSCSRAATRRDGAVVTTSRCARTSRTSTRSLRRSRDAELSP